MTRLFFTVVGCKYKHNKSNMKDFEEIIKPVMKWLAENKNPHTTIIVNATTAEVVEGTKVFNTDEFITD